MSTDRNPSVPVMYSPLTHSAEPSMQAQSSTFTKSRSFRDHIHDQRAPIGSLWVTILSACGLIITTAFSRLLLASSFQRWSFPEQHYRWIIQNRATIQLFLLLLSNGLALIQVRIICILINRASRIYWKKNEIRLEIIRFWNGLCVRALDWSLSLQWLVLLLVFILLTATPSAIWVGALTPVATTVQAVTELSVPQYQNMSNIQEWPSEIGLQGPILRTPKGLFAYSVGIQMQGNLLTSASTGSPVDGAIRKSTKLDNSRFTYFGRSYGVGASVGLVDDHLRENDQLQAYSYEEVGYDTAVTCTYNSSSRFIISNGTSLWIYRVHGMLPNSGNRGPEDSTYFGHSPDAIVAIGVGRYPEDPRRMLAIAAGKSYEHLNATQCSMEFKPMRFNVTVGLLDRNITVTPISTADNFVSDASTFTHVVARQFELISNDQTNLYVSLLGNSLNASIGDYIASHNSSKPPSLKEATLPALENSVRAMIDDMLMAYASAQLMIQEDMKSTRAITTTATLRVGADIYIYATFAVNTVILLLVIVELVRTKAWRGEPIIDYMDPAALMLAADAGGNRRRNTGDEYGSLVKGKKDVKARLCGDYVIALKAD